MSAADRAADVLVAHQRHSASACLCGWDILGASHAVHQVDALREAGLDIVDTVPRWVWGYRLRGYDNVYERADEDSARRGVGVNQGGRTLVRRENRPGSTWEVAP